MFVPVFAALQKLDAVSLVQSDQRYAWALMQHLTGLIRFISHTQPVSGNPWATRMNASRVPFEKDQTIWARYVPRKWPSIFGASKKAKLQDLDVQTRWQSNRA